MKNRRGEVITLTLLIVAAVATFFFAGSNLNPFKSPGQKTKQTVITKSESKPIIVKGQDGKEYILQSTKTETSTLDTNEEPKMTLWQRILALPKLIALLVVLGCVFPAFGLFMIRSYFKLKGGFKQLVVGIEEARKEMPAEAMTKLETNLSRKADASTKELVKKMKVKL